MAPAPPPVEDDTTYADETYADDTYASTQYGNSTVNGGKKKENPILKKLFASCESDALGSVHRAWAVTVLFMVLFFIVAIIEGEKFVCFLVLLLVAVTVFLEVVLCLHDIRCVIERHFDFIRNIDTRLSL